MFVLGRAGGGRQRDLPRPPCVVRWIVDESSDKESLGELGADTLHPTQKQGVKELSKSPERRVVNAGRDSRSRTGQYLGHGIEVCLPRDGET